MLEAEIISTGNEILNGELVDTNSAWLAKELTDRDIKVVRKTTVGDDTQGLGSLLRKTASATDVAVVTGGLGPTADDITAGAAASAANVSLETDPRAMEQVESFFQRKGMQMSETNKKQALLPEGAEPIENPIGSAPGFCLSMGGCLFFFLPGVPAEMRMMFEQTVIPGIKRHFGLSAEKPETSKLRVFGLGESQVEYRLQDFQEHFPEIVLGYRASFPELELSLRHGKKSRSTQEGSLQQAEAWIASRLGETVFSRSDEDLQEVVGKLLTEREQTLAIAESCTGGRISHMVTDVSGSSNYFLFSGVTYSNELKMKMLGVSAATLREYGAVSEETAREMAAGAREVSGATYGISTSGIAGPGGGTPEKPVGTVCIGVCDCEQSTARKLQFNFESRAMNKKIFAYAALDALRKHILNSK